MTAARGLEERHVLLVEDEFFIADDLQGALAAAGATVLGPISDCAEALAIAQSERIDFAVLDINLRGEFCFPVADALLARGIPFVFATGYERAVVPDRFRHAPRWEKPFDLARVVAALPDLAASPVGG